MNVQCQLRLFNLLLFSIYLFITKLDISPRLVLYITTYFKVTINISLNQIYNFLSLWCALNLCTHILRKLERNEEHTQVTPPTTLKWRSRASPLCLIYPTSSLHKTRGAEPAHNANFIFSQPTVKCASNEESESTMPTIF